MTVKALERAGDKLRIIDQTRLPGELIHKELDDYREIIRSIERLEVRGAPAIGIAAAYAMPIAALQTGHYRLTDLKKIGTEIKAARPTAVNLAWAVERGLGRVRDESPGDLQETVRGLWDEAEKIHEEDRRACAQIGEYGASLIKDGDSILTHCNTGALATGGIGTALGVVYTAYSQGKKIKVYAGETRPLLQGARLTTWELMQAGIDVTLFCDSMAAVLMARGDINHVIVGADRIARNGDTANKIGTYGLAVLAKGHGVPFYVAAPSSTYDDRIETGREIPIEQRAADEITEGFGRRTAPGGVPTFSPAFDITPGELVTCYISESGLKEGGREK